MAITFQCQCGKHLKARESSAGRRTICPKCGAPVGIPTLLPTHRGTLERPDSIIQSSRPVSPTSAREFTQSAEVNPSESPRDPATNLLPRSHLKSTRRAALREQQPEIRLRNRPRWMKLYGPTRPGNYPAADPFFGGVIVVCAISAALAVSGGFAIQLLPQALHDGWLSLPHGPLLVATTVIVLLAIVYAASFIGQAITESAEMGANSWQFDLEIGRAARCAACGLGSLLGGPILFLAGGLLYWLNCGRVTPLDWLILAELAVAGIGSWLALACGSAFIGRFALKSPTRCWSVIQSLGYRGVVWMFTVSILITLHVIPALFACQQIQNGNPGAVLWLGVCTFSGIIVATLLLSRLCRMSAHRTPKRG